MEGASVNRSGRRRSLWVRISFSHILIEVELKRKALVEVGNMSWSFAIIQEAGRTSGIEGNTRTAKGLRCL